MLAPESVSKQIETKRLKDPLYMTSKVLSMGSLFTEGDHLFIDKSHPLWLSALQLMLNQIEQLDKRLKFAMIVFRDFEGDEVLNEFFHNHGFFKVSMPESASIPELKWKGPEHYVKKLSSRSRRHFRKDIQPFEPYFEVAIQSDLSAQMQSHCYGLLEQVRQNNLGLNTFAYPPGLLNTMSLHPQWEFLTLTLKKAYTRDHLPKVVGVMFCYKNVGHTYVPAFVGMDYTYIQSHQVYRQLLYQTIKRAGALELKHIDFGMTAAFEKKKLGAVVTQNVAYLQAKDNFSLELLELMANKI